MHELLAELVAFEPSGHPFLSLYLDTRPGEAGRFQGRRQRNSLVWIKHRLSEVLSSLPSRGEARDSVEHDVEAALRYLEETLQPTTQGLALFACHARGFFRAHQFQVPLENHVALDEVPQIYPLARLLDGHEAYAVVLVDSEHARIYATALGRITQSVHLENVIERPARTARIASVAAAGGTFGAATLRYQRHLAGQVHAHFKEVVEHLEGVIRAEGLNRIILCGRGSVVGDFERQLPKAIQEKVVERLTLGVDTPENEVVRATLQVVERHMEEQTARRVDWLLQEHRSGGLGVVGVEPTLQVLNEQNLDGLVLGADFVSPGVVCRDCDFLQVEATAEGRCRNCGGETRSVADLREAMVQRAERQGAAVHSVNGNPDFRRYGAVGAMLRYRRPAETASS